MEFSTWEDGERNRPLQFQGPCPCGCSPDYYLSASNEDGDGWTITFEQDEVFRVLGRFPGKSAECCA